MSSSAIAGRDSARSRSTCIVAMNRRSALTAAAPRFGTCSGSDAASQTEVPVVLVKASRRDIEVEPIPRRGALTIRVNAPASCGFTSVIRYAIASLISARS